MAFSGPSRLSTYSNPTGLSYSNRSFLKKCHFLDLAFSVPIVIITIGVTYSNRSPLKKWHFVDLICSILVVTFTIGISYSNRSFLKKWHFPDLVCARKSVFKLKKECTPSSIALLGRAGCIIIAYNQKSAMTYLVKV